MIGIQYVLIDAQLLQHVRSIIQEGFVNNKWFSVCEFRDFVTRIRQFNDF